MSLELLNVNTFINPEKDQFHLFPLFFKSATSCRCLLLARWTEGLSLMFTDGTGTSAVCRSVWIPLVFLYLGHHGCFSCFSPILKQHALSLSVPTRWQVVSLLLVLESLERLKIYPQVWVLAVRDVVFVCLDGSAGSEGGSVRDRKICQKLVRQ